MEQDQAYFDAVDLLHLADDMGWSSDRLMAAMRYLVEIDMAIDRLAGLVELGAGEGEDSNGEH